MSCGSLGTASASVLLAHDHPLADRAELGFDDLAAYPVVDPIDFEHFSQAVVGAAVEHGLRSERVRLLMGDHERSQELFARGGFTFIVAGNLTGSGPGRVIRPLRAADALSVPICLSTLRTSGAIDYVEFRRALARLNLLS